MKMSDDMMPDEETIQKILGDSDGGKEIDAPVLDDMPDRKPEYDHSTFSRDQLWFKRENLEEHLGELQESMVWALDEVDQFEQTLEINPAKKDALVKAVNSIGKELEMVMEEVKDIDSHLNAN
jgi:hypothetical protein